MLRFEYKKLLRCGMRIKFNKSHYQVQSKTGYHLLMLG